MKAIKNIIILLVLAINGGYALEPPEIDVWSIMESPNYKRVKSFLSSGDPVKEAVEYAGALISSTSPQLKEPDWKKGKHSLAMDCLVREATALFNGFKPSPQAPKLTNDISDVGALLARLETDDTISDLSDCMTVMLAEEAMARVESRIHFSIWSQNIEQTLRWRCLRSEELCNFLANLLK